jgi:CTP synthase (UTP-ammonia lyase)
LPFLGICFGYQLTAIEYARNILGIKDATSEEFGQGTLVVKKLPDINIGIKKVKNRYENFWNNYEVTIKFEIPENFFVCQYHPEYNSSKDNPHPLLLNFLQYAKMAMPNSKKPW